ncbi:hypothetical protein V6Z11_D11G145300 [Gossypium hirsutum]
MIWKLKAPPKVHWFLMAHDECEWIRVFWNKFSLGGLLFGTLWSAGELFFTKKLKVNLLGSSILGRCFHR